MTSEQKERLGRWLLVAFALLILWAANSGHKVKHHPCDKQQARRAKLKSRRIRMKSGMRKPPRGATHRALALFAAGLLGPTVDRLAELARRCRALEFAIGCAGGPLR